MLVEWIIFAVITIAVVLFGGYMANITSIFRKDD